jgi:hypothetical protein
MAQTVLKQKKPSKAIVFGLTVKLEVFRPLDLFNTFQSKARAAMIADGNSITDPGRLAKRSFGICWRLLEHAAFDNSAKIAIQSLPIRVP